MLDALLKPLLSALFPKLKPWARRFLAFLIPGLVTLVQEIVDAAGSDEEAAEASIAAVSKFLDDSLDFLPVWRDVSEKDRDDIIVGLTKLALLVASETKPARKDLVKKIKDLRPIPRVRLKV